MDGVGGRRAGGGRSKAKTLVPVTKINFTSMVILTVTWRPTNEINIDNIFFYFGIGVIFKINRF